jgi:steroid delta-isomerase-like uncharacterized protein
MSAENKEVVRKFMDECWNQGKLERVRDLVSEKCHHHDPVFPNLAPGTENLKKHISMCRNGFPDLNFKIDDMIAERNEVVIHWSARGTHKGQFLGMPPTSQKANVTGTSIYRLENGKITEQWSDWNLMSLMNQLGIIAAPGAEAKAAR